MTLLWILLSISAAVLFSIPACLFLLISRTLKPPRKSLKSGTTQAGKSSLGCSGGDEQKKQSSVSRTEEPNLIETPFDPEKKPPQVFLQVMIGPMDLEAANGTLAYLTNMFPKGAIASAEMIPVPKDENAN